MTDALLGDEPEQQCETACVALAQRAGAELAPQLDGVLEAQHSRRATVLGGGQFGDRKRHAEAALTALRYLSS